MTSFANMKSSEKQLAIAASVVIGVAVSWLYVAQPLYNDWATARDRVDGLQRTLEKARELLDSRPKLEAERNSIERALIPPLPTDELFTPADLGSAAIPAFLEHLNNLAKQAHLTLADLRHVPRPMAFESYAELKFELRGRAPIKNVQDFLVRMAASERYLRVQALSLHPRDNGLVEADLTLVGLATQDALEPEDKDRQGGKRR